MYAAGLIINFCGMTWQLLKCDFLQFTELDICIIIAWTLPTRNGSRGNDYEVIVGDVLEARLRLHYCFQI